MQLWNRSSPRGWTKKRKQKHKLQKTSKKHVSSSLDIYIYIYIYSYRKNTRSRRRPLFRYLKNGLDDYLFSFVALGSFQNIFVQGHGPKIVSKRPIRLIWDRFKWNFNYFRRFWEDFWKLLGSFLEAQLCTQKLGRPYTFSWKINAFIRCT